MPIGYKNAFGKHASDLTFVDDLTNSPVEHRFVGAELEMHNDKGGVVHFRVTEIADGKITIDANHLLAGKDITFIIKVCEVRASTKLELADQPGFTVQ